MRKKVYKIPIYFGELIVVKAKNWDKINKKYGYSLDKTYEAAVFKESTKKGKLQYFVVFTTKISDTTIAHETVHIVNLIFSDRMIDLDLKNDEPQAYLTGWVFDRIKKFIKNK